MAGNENTEYIIDEDMEEARGVQEEEPFAEKLQWAPLFTPREFVQESDDWSLEAHELPREQLQELGEDVSNLRNKIMKKVELAKMDAADLRTNAKKGGDPDKKKVESRLKGKRASDQGRLADALLDQTPVSSRRKGSSRRRLPIDSQISVLHRMLVKKELPKDLA